MSRVYSGSHKHNPGGKPAVSAARTAGCSLIVFGVFLAYYLFSSSLLPMGAGPDYAASNDVVQFIYTHDRLAVLPEDEDKLQYTAYGGTRALRPPFSYIVSAKTAKVLAPWVPNSFIAFRKGSSLLCAATVAVVFYAAFLYFDSYLAGLIAALLFGLLPQFAFIASYNNDDSGAIFSASLLLCALVRILRKGVNWPNVILLGAASGLVILSKQSAWILAPTVVLFLAAFVRVPWRKLLSYGAVGLAVLIAAGGWWILFNIYHYGVDDPFAIKVETALAEKYTRFPPDKEFGYAAQGVGYSMLLLGNHDDFWLKTIASTIGNLDWLRIRVGPLQYGLYLLLFAAGMLYALLRLCGAACSRVRDAGRDLDKDVIFEGLLVFAVAFQFYMYLWANMNNDVQLQGKYLLPAFLAVVLLGMSAAGRVLRAAAPVMMDSRPKDLLISGRAVRKGSIAALLVVLVGVHIDAIVNYVIPFYRPPVYPMRLHRELQDIVIPERYIMQSNEVRDFSATGNGFRLVSEGVDPWFVVDISSRGMCRLFEGHNLLRATVRSRDDGIFKVYVDRGDGFTEKDSMGVRYAAGESEIILVFDVPRCSRLRIDPATGATPVEVEGLSLGKIVVGK